MQTFLPYPSFVQSAKCLDYKRLGKQRVEAGQILSVLLGETTGWKNHPAAKMWEGYEGCLRIYQSIMIRQWINRGYKNTMIGIEAIISLSDADAIEFEAKYAEKFPEQIPPWIGRDEFHASHRAALLYKEPVHYGKFGWTEEPKECYWWPTKNE